MTSEGSGSFSKEVESGGNMDRKSSVSSASSSSSSSFNGSIEHRAINNELRVESRGLNLTRDVSPAIGAAAAPELGRVITGRSIATNATTDPSYQIDFEEDGSDNPKNWSMMYKSMIIGFVSFSTTMVVMYSTSYASGIPGMMSTFGITNETVVVLGITTYLFGMAAGSVVLAPLSEMYGRKPIYIGALTLFTLLLIPCALAPNIEAILITRFFGAVCGSAMVSNAPGTVSDIVSDEYRALAFSIWSIGPMNGPVIGPLIGGFVYQYMGWRWTNWVVMMGGGISLIMLLSFKETYAPALLRQKAAKQRKETGDDRWWTEYDERKEFWGLLRVNLSRPFIMAVTEPICIFWNIYIAIVYAILYLCFVAYPIIFSEERGWSPGITGLAYAGIGVGSLITITCEPLFRRLINSYRPDRTRPPGPSNAAPPEAMMTAVCIAAVLIPTGELIFAWTSPRNVHWIAPILAGIPFGAGNGAVFIYASNYLVHSYGIYAASALAGNAVLRSVIGGTLPLAGPTMYKVLGSAWSGTLLGLLEVLCIPIPFVFWRYGARIRMKSSMIRSLREDQERMEGKRRRREEQLARIQSGDAEKGTMEEPESAVVEKRVLGKEVEV